MSAAALPPPPSAPRHRRAPQPHDTLPSFVIAIAMHALLFASMWYVVRWKTQDPAPVVAELWVSTPQPVVEVPAPPPPPPPPPPKIEQPEPPKPTADIVTKEEKKPPPKVEPPKVEEKKPPPPKKVEPKKDAIADLLKKQEEQSRAERDAIRKAEADRIERQMAQAAGPTPQPGTGRASADYIARLTALIKSRINYVVPDGTSTSVYAEVQVELLPSGEVVGIRFLKESGLPAYDSAVERAIRATDPFPRKPDGTVDRTVVIRFRPVEPQN